MHHFKVWAPLVNSLSVQADGRSFPMSGPDHDGWWGFAVESAAHGTDYGFLIDKDPKTYPDPRSRSQPGGVHALSRVYDQSEFRWTDQGFNAPPLASASFFELH